MKHLSLKRISLLLIFLSLTVVLARTSVTSQNNEDSSSIEAFSEEGINSSKLRDGTYIEVNLPATRMEFYVHGELQKSYPVAIGMDIFPTPVKNFYISQIIWNPWWIPPDSEWARNDHPTPPGPDNPLGPVKMLLQNGVRIHGTSQPNSIGNAASHSCIRMHSEDAIELAWEIQKRYSSQNSPQLLETYKSKSDQTFYVGLSKGIPVIIRYKQVEVSGNKLLLHPDRYDRGGFQRELEVALAGRSDVHLNQDLIERLNEMRQNESVEINLDKLNSIKKGYKNASSKTKKNWRQRHVEVE